MTVKHNGQSALLSQLGKLAVFVVMTGGLLYGVLSLVQPQYRSVAQIQVKQAVGGDKNLVAAQIKALRSKQLVNAFIKRHDLAKDSEFNGVLGRTGPLARVSMMLGLADNPADLPKDKRLYQAVGGKIGITRGRKPQTINIAVRTNQPDKSARFANQYAKAYIAGLVLSPTISKSRASNHPDRALVARLSDRIAAGEAEFVALREDINNNPLEPAAANRAISETSISGGSAMPGVKLSEEQLSDLMSKHILAKADREEALMRARLVRQMLEQSGELHSTNKVLNSGLVQRLLFKRSRMERQIADLSVTLLPSHPQLKRLVREMSALKAQIRGEAKKLVVHLDDEAKIAMAREKSLADSLLMLKETPVKPLVEQPTARGELLPQTDDRKGRLEELLRVIDNNKLRLAAAQTRLDTALQGTDRSIAPKVTATIVAKAFAAKTPVFPKKLSITALGMVLAFGLGIFTLMMSAKRRGKDFSDHQTSMAPSQEKSLGGFGAQPERSSLG